MDELYVRKLPRWRLTGSEPRVPATQGLPDERVLALRDTETDRAATGPVWLADPGIAQMVRDRIMRLADILYDLAVWVIPAYQVYRIILPKIPSREIMPKLKGARAYTANQVLGRTGPFWYDESYDHWIRSEARFNRVIRSVGRNPVKAGLVVSIEHWQWSSARSRTG